MPFAGKQDQKKIKLHLQHVLVMQSLHSEHYDNISNTSEVSSEVSTKDTAE